MSIPPPLTEIDTREFRRRLAGLADPREQVDAKLAGLQRKNAIKFVATLPQLFGPDLQRLTLWNRIGSAIESALAKTAGPDTEAFITAVLDHLRTRHAAAAASVRLHQVLQVLGDAGEEERQEFLDWLAVHRYAVLVHARAEWERYKEDKAAGRDTSWWGEEIDFDALFHETAEPATETEAL